MKLPYFVRCLWLLDKVSVAKGLKLLTIILTSVMDPNQFIRIRIHKFFFRIRILRIIFWPQIFPNGASNFFHMCSGTCTSEKTQKNIFFFVFQVYDLRFFTRFFILQQCLDPNPNFFSDSDPARIFGFGSTTLILTKMSWLVYSKINLL
jgi:hypothetical protein